ncbi:type II secretion system protein [Methylocella silvestris BL2]|uniref:Type II secretion system protein n=1 Tax=Methylocella silvestris (strain DSM 15510 / CIP 108128 / LMG 27833 / NCIMB 13906 / BL2) TaxID=395965 RepID=B8ERR7_METSB|nr:type II secretion system protein [Methylocella silvestris BL2]
MSLFGALAITTLLFGAMAIAVALVLSRNAAAQMSRRLNLVAADENRQLEADTLAELVKAQTKKFDAQVRRIFTLGIERTWAMQASSLTLVLLALVLAGGAWVLFHNVLGFSQLPAVGISIFASYFGPRLVLVRRQRKTERQFMDLFPDAVDTVARMIRAGLPITAAVRTIASEAGAPISTVFAMIADELKIGVPIEQTLDASSKQIGLADFRFFAVAVALQYSTGGNLMATLEALSQIVRKRRALRLKAKAATGEIRITAYALGGIPVLTSGALFVLQPGYLAPLWTDPRGPVILMAAGGLLFLAYLSMRMIMRGVTAA